jgi:cytochrome b561
MECHPKSLGDHSKPDKHRNCHRGPGLPDRRTLTTLPAEQTREHAPAMTSHSSAAPANYSLLQIILHWTIAALIIFQLLVHDGMELAFDDRMDGEPVENGIAAAIHIGVGLAVLVLGILRLAIRLVRGAPPAHEDKPLIITWIGYLTHFALYGFIFAMPLTGIAAWFGHADAAAELHELGRLILIPVIAFHVLGAFAEHFVFRNNALLRMLSPKVGPTEAKLP